jgi:LuxR family maltose regulon positive regulatory protein
LDQLDEEVARELTLVCAPAGFGKTAMPADWAHRGARSIAWLALDAGDNDPTRFWRHAAGALDRVRPRGRRAGSSAARSAGTVVVRKADDWVGQRAGGATGRREVLLVLDDYHLIEAQQVHGSVALPARAPAGGLHLVLASRADPLLPMARWRARGQ